MTPTPSIADRFEQLWQSTLVAIPGVLVGLGVVLATFAIARLVKAGARALARRSGYRPDLALLIARLFSGLTITLGLVVALSFIVPGLDLAAAMGALGLGGLIIGFALKDIVQNFLAGILILFNRPFRIGDQIRTRDHEGTVEDIQVRATLLRTYDNRRIVIPNSELFADRVSVLTAYDQVRQAVSVAVPDTMNVAAARSLILGAITDLPEVRSSPQPQVLVRDLLDHAVALEVRFWVDPPVRRELLLAEDAVLTALHEAFLAAGIPDVMPAQRIIIDKEVA